MWLQKKKQERSGDFPELLGVIYLDSSCMSRRPYVVIDKIREYYEKYPVCAGRSTHRLSTKLESEITKARTIVQKFINAKHAEEIIFTRNTTEGINWISQLLDLKEGDVVLTTDKEHNSNLIPWLKLAEKGVIHDIFMSKKDNTFDMETYLQKLKHYGNKVKLVSVGHTSNLDGVSIPLKEITRIAHSNGALVLADGAQTCAHHIVDVQDLNIDFYAFSGHKMCGPSGIGVLYMKKEHADSLGQFLVGGDTVVKSTYKSYEPEQIPNKYEAGLQNYPGILGLGTACSYLTKQGMKKIEAHEIALNTIITQGLADEINSGKIVLVGPKDPKLRGGIFNFYIPGKDYHEFAQLLDKTYGIAVRSGQHCVHSWHEANNIKGTIRCSLYLYNTGEEAKKFVLAVKELLTLG